jgi:protein-S-isoprenylcysteine O-methyltransferase Ste14
MSQGTGPGVHVPPPVFFVSAFAAGWFADGQRPWPMRDSIERAPSLDAAGIGLIVGAALLVGWAILTLWRARTTIMPHRAASAIVTAGPYRFTRNPMYVAMTGAYIGASLLAGTWWTMVLLPIPVLVVAAWVVPREERHLRQSFGDDYIRYTTRVRRWL